jgi:hypothetical protein
VFFFGRKHIQGYASRHPPSITPREMIGRCFVFASFFRFVSRSTTNRQPADSKTSCCRGNLRWQTATYLRQLTKNEASHSWHKCAPTNYCNQPNRLTRVRTFSASGFPKNEKTAEEKKNYSHCSSLSLSLSLTYYHHCRRRRHVYKKHFLIYSPVVGDDGPGCVRKDQQQQQQQLSGMHRLSVSGGSSAILCTDTSAERL